MRAFIYLAVAVFAAVVAASDNANPFKVPRAGYSFTTGETTTLEWTPTTSGTVSLRLQHGAVTTENSGMAIVSGIANDGSYAWTVPEDVPDQSYTIEIISDSDSSDYNFTPQFTIEGASAAAPSSSAAPSSTTMSTTTTSEPTTTESTTTSESTSTTTTSGMTTMTTATSATTTDSSTSTSTSTSTADSSSSPSGTSPSSAPGPTNNAGIANRVSGGMLALVAGAIAVM